MLQCDIARCLHIADFATICVVTDRWAWFESSTTFGNEGHVINPLGTSASALFGSPLRMFSVPVSATQN